MSSPAKPPVNYTGVSARPSIPLIAEKDVDPSASMGALVKDATVHLSTLVRSEPELAKLELTATVKTGVLGSAFFIGAAAIGLFSLFFIWLTVAEVLDLWMPRWLAFLIVVVVMLAMAGALAFLGLRKIKKIGKPERTISTLSESASTLKAAATHNEPTAGR